MIPDASAAAASATINPDSTPPRTRSLFLRCRRATGQVSALRGVSFRAFSLGALLEEHSFCRAAMEVFLRIRRMDADES